jgi:hypothetical protein
VQCILARLSIFVLCNIPPNLANMSFEVPGFNLPNQVVPGATKKRKRPSQTPAPADDEVPAVNVEKLLSKYEKLLKASPTVAPKVKPGKAKAATAKAPAPAAGPSKPNPKHGQKPARKPAQALKSPPAPKPATSEASIPDEGQPKSKKQKKQAASTAGLSDMQNKMKGKLEGARFRWINEQLVSPLVGLLALGEAEIAVHDGWYRGREDDG